jgi:glucosamine kinase
MASHRVVIGLDGGGTHTRVLCCALDGQVLAYAQTGGSSPTHNTFEDAERNSRLAIADALRQAERTPADVMALTAGMAGLDSPKDHEWAERFTALPDLTAARVHVNDAVIAHAGALQSRPGIIVICGTGSILYAVNEAGQAENNYHYLHYANASGRSLALDALHRLLAGEAQTADAVFIEDTLAFWQVQDLTGLRERIAAFHSVPWTEKVHAFGKMASLVTDFALRSSPLCRRVCGSGAEAVRIGICLLGAAFAARPVAVALIGSSARSPAMQQAIAAELLQAAPGQYQLVEPVFPSEAGAVLMALRQCGVTPDETLLERLRSSLAAMSSLSSASL